KQIPGAVESIRFADVAEGSPYEYQRNDDDNDGEKPCDQLFDEMHNEVRSPRRSPAPLVGGRLLRLGTWLLRSPGHPADAHTCAGHLIHGNLLCYCPWIDARAIVYVQPDF